MGRFLPKLPRDRTLLPSSTSTSPMDWFECLVGFKEQSPEQVRHFLALDGEYIRSTANNRRIGCGRLDIPSLSQLRAQTADHSRGPIRVREVVRDARTLHESLDSEGATFQVASQFNLLEMVHPSITPEMGVGRYGTDFTQGPACAVACGGGTIYRNYFVHVGEQIGQTEDVQINTLKEFGEAVGNENGSVWVMRNGYALGKKEGLERVGRLVKGLDEVERDRLRGLVRVGVQYDVEVTSGMVGQSVTQVYCAAFPVNYEYSGFGRWLWEDIARVLLEGVYESTLRSAIVNMKNGGSNKVYLTLVGGGVFGNDIRWIVDAMKRSFEVMSESGLDVAIVSYRKSQAELDELFR